MSRKKSQPVAYRRNGEQVVRDGQLGWRLRVWDARASRQREETFFGTFAQAQAELEQRAASVAAQVQPAQTGAERLLVGQWAVQWLNDYQWKVRPAGRNPGVQRPETTWLNAKAVLRAYILPQLGHRVMATLTYRDCYDFVAALRVNGGNAEASVHTKEKVASVLRRMFTDARRAGVLVADPAADLPSTWGTRRKRTVVPSLVQVEQLAAELDRRWEHRGAIVRLFAFSGLRWEELAALRWEDVDFDNRSLHVFATRPSSLNKRSETTKTGASDRYATILDQALEPLTTLRGFAEERGSQWVLSGERGGPLSYGVWRKQLKRARDNSEVPYTAHELRHVAASLLIAGGASPTVVRDQMGHTRTSVTETVYRHAWAMDRRRLAAELTAAVTTVEVEELNDEA